MQPEWYYFRYGSEVVVSLSLPGELLEFKLDFSNTRAVTRTDSESESV